MVSCEFVFYQCHNLKFVDLSYFDMSNVTNFRSMFEDCRSLIGVNTSSVTTSLLDKVYIGNLFRNCWELRYVSLDFINAHHVIDYRDSFSYCESLAAISFPGFDIAESSETWLEDGISICDCGKLKLLYCIAEKDLHAFVINK